MRGWSVSYKIEAEEGCSCIYYDLGLEFLDLSSISISESDSTFKMVLVESCTVFYRVKPCLTMEFG